MDLEHLRYGGGPNETLLHPAVLAAMIIAILAMFLRVCVDAIGV